MLAAAEQLVAALLTWNPRARASCASVLGSSPYLKGVSNAPAAATIATATATALGSVGGANVDLAKAARPQSRRMQVKDGAGQWGASVQRRSSKEVMGSWSAVIDDTRLRELFVRFDADSSGAIDKWELALLLVELGLLSGAAGPDQEAATRQWLAKMDADGNGTIEWEELKEWWNAPGGGKATVAAARLVPKLRKRVSTRRAATGGSGAAKTTGSDGGKGTSAKAEGGGEVGVAGLSRKHTHALRSLFMKHDADFSGFIDQNELLPLLVDLGVIAAGGDETDADELLAEMEMADMDANGDDKVSFEELCGWWARSGRGAPPERADIAAAKALTRRLVGNLDL